MLTSGMLNLVPESVFVLVMILLVVLALHALAVMAAFACRLVYGIQVILLGPIDDATCKPLGMPNQILRSED